MFALWLVLASVTACGGSGTSSVTCGPGTILVKDQCLPEGADGSPGDGGVDAKSDSYQGGTSSCSNPRVIAVENAVVEDFEMGARWWFSYQDGTGTLTGTTVNQGPTESNSAEVPGSQAAAHLVGSGFTDFGAGLGFSGWLRCVDLRAFAGISFWAKGGKGTGTSLADGPILDWLTPATLPVQFGGDCTTGCNDYQNVQFLLTEQWQKYSFRWNQFSQRGFGTPAPFTEANVLGINVVFLGAKGGVAFDLWLDNVVLFN